MTHEGWDVCGTQGLPAVFGGDKSTNDLTVLNSGPPDCGQSCGGKLQVDSGLWYSAGTEKVRRVARAQKEVFASQV